MLQVRWSDDAERTFPLVWLRDNCVCPDCVHPHTRERTFDLLTVPQNLTLTSAKAEPDALEIHWREGQHVSRFPSTWLRGFLEDGTQAPLRPAPSLWKRGPIA